MRDRPVITIDGPAGAGKSTAARRLAQGLGLRCLDTSALYRALTFGCLEAGVDPTSDASTSFVAGTLAAGALELVGSRLTFRGRDVSPRIRGSDVTSLTPVLAAKPSIRALVEAWQQSLLAAGGIVMEGPEVARLAPDADFKFILTASVAVRARRISPETTVAAARWDEADRTVRAEDAVEIDTSTLSADEVVRALATRVRAAMARQPLAEAEVHERGYGQLVLLAGNTRGRMRTHKADLKVLHIRPGEETSHHRHWVAESLYHVLAGVLTYTLDGVEGRLEPGDTLIVRPGATHQLRCIGREPARVLEVESPPHDSSDKHGVDCPVEVARQRVLGPAWDDQPRTRVKICGVANLDAALLCRDAGADAIGFHAVGEDRMARVRAAERWLSAVPDELSVFLLTDADDPHELAELARRAYCDTIQHQGARSPAVVEACAVVLRATGVKHVEALGLSELGEDAIEYARRIAPLCDALLLDSSFRGGTGEVGNWALARRVVDAVPGTRIYIAGGLSAQNVADAIRTTGAYGVDVESGVETHLLPRTGERRVTARCREKIIAFVAAVRGAS